MHVSFVQEGKTLKAKIEGELDMLVADELRKKIDAEINRTAVRELIFDLSLVGFIDSSGLGVMVGRYNRLQAFGGTVSVCGAGERIYHILELSGITRIMQVRKLHDGKTDIIDIMGGIK